MIVIPSRGRPQSLAAFFLTSRPRTPGIVLLDDDDADAYAGITVPESWTVLVGSRAGYAALLNRAFERFPDEPWYANLGDDCRARPEWWDVHLAAMAVRHGVAYGNDCINGETTCGFPFISGDLVRTIGWLAYPPLGHLYSDTIWREIGLALGRLRYCPDVVTEHLHWSTGKQPYDRTAQERPIANDPGLYERFMAQELATVVRRCQA